MQSKTFLNNLKEIVKVNFEKIFLKKKWRYSKSFDKNLEQIILISENTENLQVPIKDIAIHVHAFYLEILPEIRLLLEKLSIKYTLYISTDLDFKIEEIKNIFFGLHNVTRIEISTFENRGRDIAPMVIGFGSKLAKYEIVLHLHTKKSPHNIKLRGWRRYLYASLIGNDEIVKSIIKIFNDDIDIELMYPLPYYPIQPYLKIGGNRQNLEKLFLRAGLEVCDFSKLNMKEFPAGFMFWCRGSLIKKLIDLGLSQKDFEIENGQDDGTLAHSIERFMPHLVKENFKKTKSYLPEFIYSELQPGAVPLKNIDKFYDFKNPVDFLLLGVSIDAEEVSKKELYSNVLFSGGSIVTIRKDTNGGFFIDLVCQDHGMLFYEGNIKSLLLIIKKLKIKKIINLDSEDEMLGEIQNKFL